MFVKYMMFLILVVIFPIFLKAFYVFKLFDIVSMKVLRILVQIMGEQISITVHYHTTLTVVAIMIFGLKYGV